MGCRCSTMEMKVLRSLLYLRDEASFAKTSCAVFDFRSGEIYARTSQTKKGGVSTWMRHVNSGMDG